MQDGTWSIITGSCTVVRDVKDMLLHSYFSIMDEVRLHVPPDGKPYEIRSTFCYRSAFSILPDKITTFSVLLPNSESM
jgi:hypothetical protein